MYRYTIWLAYPDQLGQMQIHRAYASVVIEPEENGAIIGESTIYIYNDYPQDPTMDIAWVVGLA